MILNAPCDGGGDGKAQVLLVHSLKSLFLCYSLRLLIFNIALARGNLCLRRWDRLQFLL